MGVLQGIPGTSISKFHDFYEMEILGMHGKISNIQIPGFLKIGNLGNAWNISNIQIPGFQGNGKCIEG